MCEFLWLGCMQLCVLLIVLISVVVLPFVGFAVCLFLLYSLMPLVMAKIGAMAVNLNLLSSDFYALLLGLFFFRYKVGYWISLYRDICHLYFQHWFCLWLLLCMWIFLRNVCPIHSKRLSGGTVYSD